MSKNLNLPPNPFPPSTFRHTLHNFFLPLIAAETSTLLHLQTRQKKYKAWDKIMRVAGIVGTHTFYLLVLPLTRWLHLGIRVREKHGMSRWSGGDVQTINSDASHRELDLLWLFGRDLISLLAVAVMITGILKDLLSLPRPSSPPIARLSKTEEATHLEFGFPSTHTSTSIIMAFSFILTLYTYTSWDLTWWIFAAVLYSALVSWSRLYCGLHSFTDLAGGLIVAVATCFIWYLLDAVLEIWTKSLPAPILSSLAFTYALILIHPHPSSPCPCFEDSISFAAVLCGVFVAAQMSLNDVDIDAQGPRNVVCGILRIVVGVTLLLSWRTFTKRIFANILPAIFGIRDTPKNHQKKSDDKADDEASRVLQLKKVDSFAIINDPNGSHPALNTLSNYNHDHHRRKWLPNEYKLDKWSLLTLGKVVCYGGIGFIAIHGALLVFGVLGI